MKVFIQTYGCQMNEYDSSAMMNVLARSHQAERVTTPEIADILLINTCAVRHKAEEKFFSELGLWRKLKEKRPHIVIGVGGCVASQEGNNIRKRAPYVDIIFGPQTLHRLPDMLNEVFINQKPVTDISFPEIEKFDQLPPPRAEGVRAFLSIMEGCSKYCSYCIVPYTRGEEISRPLQEVLTEALVLANQGVREITLLGQNVNDYQGKMPNGDIADLALLIHYIAEIDSILRIRFTTSHPLAFSDRLIHAYATQPKLANQLHLPVQSGSNRILRLMKRGYTVESFIQKIEKLRQVRPDISITSDFIIGFPNETAQDFDETIKLIEHIKFDNAFSFIYSPRPGTPAANLPDTVSLDTKKQRLYQIQELLKQQMQAFSKSMLNQTYNVLTDGISKKNPQALTGRTDNNRIVNFTKNIYHAGGENCLQQHIGSVLPVKITEIKTNSLKGECLL